MTITDILTFVGIAVSIIFGFFITHFNSVRDTRTRVIKDHYIEQLKQIKGRVDTFFHRVAFGKSSFRKLVIWYEHIRLDITGIDESVRKVIDLQIDKFGEVLYHYYDEITQWEDFNNQYRCPQYKPSNESRERLLQIKYEIDDYLNDYIQHVNQANPFSIWRILINRIKQNRIYYATHKSKCPLIRAVWERVEKHFGEILITLLIIVVFSYLCFNIKPEVDQDLKTPLLDISVKQDSLVKSIKAFEEKYEPVNVNARVMNNVTFFNEEKLDSINNEH